MSCNCNVTIEYFKTLFARDFPYLPLYEDGKAYFKGDVVYYENNFYKSKIDENETDPSNTTNWALVNETVHNYIQDTDIEKAFEEADLNFNASLFTCCNKWQLVFCYLAAHYLVIDLNNALNPLALGTMGFTQSKSVGSVSESYGIPQWIMNDPNLGMYAQTGYGRKYLSLIRPYLVGNIIFTPGAINFG